MMDDSDRNILASLQHEGCEVCCFCDEHICPRPVTSNPLSEWDFECYADDDREMPCHQECFDWAMEAAEDARAESIMESRLADDEAAFNGRWPT